MQTTSTQVRKRRNTNAEHACLSERQPLVRESFSAPVHSFIMTQNYTNGARENLERRAARMIINKGDAHRATLHQHLVENAAATSPRPLAGALIQNVHGATVWVLLQSRRKFDFHRR